MSGSRWGAFLSGNYVNTDRDSTDRETGFNSDTWGFTGGIDYRWTEQFLLGVAFSYSETDADLNANSGSLESDTWGVFGYGTITPMPDTYLDFTIGYSESSHDQERNVVFAIQQINIAPALAGVGPPIPLAGVTTVNQTAISDTDSEEFSFSATLGRDWRSGNVTFGPYAGVSYADVEIDGFRERMSNPNAAGGGLALFINDQDYESLMSRVGGAATFTFDGPWGPIFPYLMAEYVHEFEKRQRPRDRWLHRRSEPAAIFASDGFAGSELREPRRRIYREPVGRIVFLHPLYRPRRVQRPVRARCGIRISARILTTVTVRSSRPDCAPGRRTLRR